MAAVDSLREPLVLAGAAAASPEAAAEAGAAGAAKGGSSVGGVGVRTALAAGGLALLVVLLCGPWSPLPGWLTTLLLVVALVPAAALLLQLVLVKAAKAALEQFDREYLGVDVVIGYLSFNAFKGRLQVADLKVHNPAGYSGEYMLEAKNFVFDLDMRRTLGSLGREVEVSELTVQGITANLEFAGLVYGKSNVSTILEHIKNATKQKQGDIQPVYNFWHEGNGEHTFHREPAWPGEEQKGAQFYAHATQAPGTEPVYDFWHSWYREHTFRMGDGEPCSMEWKGNVHFYAFPEQAANTEPVYEFWHVGNKEHTLHFLPAWDREEVGEVKFYAYRRDPTSKAKETEFEAALKPVYDFWHSGQGQHQFHFLPAWGGERKGKAQFYAFTKQVPGTEPVYDFYIQAKNKKTFHLGPPREGEEKYSALFWVYTQPVQGTLPVYEFWHEGNQEYNLHCGEPWEGEEKREVQFYAFRQDPAKKKKIFLRNVALQKVKAKSKTRLLGASVNLEDMRYDDFSSEFDACTPDALVSSLLNELFGKVSVGMW
uniref:Uncharacterized protein n=1 Tax=Pyrodinium bahamense TaxID=73915 RepID=A0A7S0A0G7_9DINO